ncbi:hypothetical protein HZS_6267 [Henneguya salminicola]|nr:hypothetical protein HZS_6267 [Henneguya salminicola]
MSRRNEYLYCKLLHAIIVQLKYVRSQQILVVNFEKALFNSIKFQFYKSKIIVGYFQMLQVIFLRMKKDRIPDDKAQIALNMMRSLPSI